MRLENIKYSKEFRNLIIKILLDKRQEIYKDDNEDESDDLLRRIDKEIFILENGLITEYDKIDIEIDDYVYDKEVSKETSNQVLKIFTLFKEIEGYIKNNDDLNCILKLRFRGFNAHDDGDFDKGHIYYAEYLIDHEKKFQNFKDIYREGHDGEMERYIDILKFFENKEINMNSIIEYSQKK